MNSQIKVNIPGVRTSLTVADFLLRAGYRKCVQYGRNAGQGRPQVGDS